MDYKKKLKIRLYTAFAIFAAGIAMMIIGYLKSYEVVSSFGLMWLVIGIAHILKHFRITKNEETLHKYEVAETDERNIKIWEQARNLTFTVYIILASLMIVVLYILNLQTYGMLLSINLMVLVVIYWVCYFITSRKY